MPEITINDINYQQFVQATHVDPVTGRPLARGLVPRDFGTHPVGCYACAKPFDLPLIPESEWQARLDAIVAAKAQLSDIRNRGMNGSPIPSTDQNGRGYCWCHSGTSATMLCRAVANQPYVELSAYFVGCIIKNYRDEGGWGPAGVEFMAEHGIPSAQFWPQRSVSRSNDTPEMRANAKLHRVEEWMDLDPGQMKAQMVTCLLNGIPVVSDFNWWGHSVCTVDLVSINPFKTRIWNSWGDSWSENGMGILEGSKAIPNDAIAPRSILPATI